MKARQKYLVICGGFFLLLVDQFLKFQALHAWSGSHLMLRGWFGWQLFLNPGIAFSLPLPAALIPLLTIFILLALGYYALTWPRPFTVLQFGAGVLVAVGAVSNLVDRVAYGVTIDYIRLLTGVFNVADFCILVGVVLFFIKHKKA